MDPALRPLIDAFEGNRARLRSVAYRMLGSLSDADDAVQETWLRLQRSEAGTIDNLPGWLTTVVGRICLDVLRARASRHDDWDGHRLPDPIVTVETAADPEFALMQAGAVGMSVLFMLGNLTPGERLAFVLHDMFSLSFEEIAPVLGRSPAATRQLASRARRRMRGADETKAEDVAVQRQVVDAFVTASRSGDLGALLAILDPEAVVRVDSGGEGPGRLREMRGAQAAAEEAIQGAQRAARTLRVRVNAAAGVLALGADGRPFAVLGFTLRHARILELDVLADPARVQGLVSGLLVASG